MEGRTEPPDYDAIHKSAMRCVFTLSRLLTYITIRVPESIEAQVGYPMLPHVLLELSADATELEEFLRPARDSLRRIASEGLRAFEVEGSSAHELPRDVATVLFLEVMGEDASLGITLAPYILGYGETEERSRSLSKLEHSQERILARLRVFPRDDPARIVAMLEREYAKATAPAHTSASPAEKDQPVLWQQARIARFLGQHENTTGLVKKESEQGGRIRRFIPPEKRKGRYTVWFTPRSLHLEALAEEAADREKARKQGRSANRRRS